jgi:RNA-directed DNA polymerase
VPIPKAGGKGVRILGVPTVDDRIAQTVAAMYLEREVEPVFHPDSYGYRPGRSALDAVGRCRERCWRSDWVIDLDIRAFFDSVDHTLMLKAVARHTDQKWILLYVQRWLVAPLHQQDGTLAPGIVEPHRALRSHRCWRTCICTTRSTRGWSGPSRR